MFDLVVAPTPQADYPTPPSPQATPSVDQRGSIDPILPPIPQSNWRPPPDDGGMRTLTAPDSPVIVKNGADGAIRPGVTRQAGFAIPSAAQIDQIMTYHYGARKRPGTITLRHSDGTVYGPWQAAGAVGQGDMPNAYWWVRPEISLKPGYYTVIDSDPATWNWEEATQGGGIFVIWGQALQ